MNWAVVYIIGSSKNTSKPVFLNYFLPLGLKTKTEFETRV